MMLKPKNISHNICRYSDPFKQLTYSDVDKLMGVHEEPLDELSPEDNLGNSSTTLEVSINKPEKMDAVECSDKDIAVIAIPAAASSTDTNLADAVVIEESSDAADLVDNNDTPISTAESDSDISTEDAVKVGKTDTLAVGEAPSHAAIKVVESSAGNEAAGKMSEDGLSDSTKCIGDQKNTERKDDAVKANDDHVDESITSGQIII